MHARCYIAAAALIVVAAGCSNSREDSTMDSPTISQTSQQAGPAARETATFAAGCFWGVEAAFRRVKGVTSTVVGYTGGHTTSPAYEEVCTDRTGHAEAVQVTYDPVRVTYEKLLDVFWSIHDPTTLNRQGPDVGSQYRSAVFFHTPQQAAAARASVKALEDSGKYARSIVTEITAAAKFYRAEEYHQRYLEKRGRSNCPSTSKK